MLCTPLPRCLREGPHHRCSGGPGSSAHRTTDPVSQARNNAVAPRRRGPRPLQARSPTVLLRRLIMHAPHRPHRVSVCLPAARARHRGGQPPGPTRPALAAIATPSAARGHGGLGHTRQRSQRRAPTTCNTSPWRAWPSGHVCTHSMHSTHSTPHRAGSGRLQRGTASSMASRCCCSANA